MLIIRIVLSALVCVLLCAFIKQVKPELAPIAVIASIIIVVTLVLTQLSQVLGKLNSLIAENTLIEDGYITLLIKILAIAILSKITADFCRDCGFSSIASNMELAGKIIVLSIAFPMIEVIVELVQGLLV